MAFRTYRSRADRAREAAAAEPDPLGPPPKVRKEQPSFTAAPLREGAHYIWGTGRRKKAIARVRIRPGSGKILINKRELAHYFPSPRDQEAVNAPLAAAEMTGRYDVWANVRGGGPTGQADAVKLGLARALVQAEPHVDGTLREHGLLTRDARIKERKKYGRRGARRGLQWAKR